MSFGNQNQDMSCPNQKAPDYLWRVEEWLLLEELDDELFEGLL
jgi:hypothetical protein